MTVTKELSADTQAVLLLCGYFGKATPSAAKPLSAGEYARLARWLLDRQFRPGSLLDLSPNDLTPLVDAKLEASRIRSLLQRGAALALATEKWVRSGLWILSRGDESYPARLKKHFRTDAPPLLYGAGDPKLLSTGGLAIVGSRNVSEAGLDFTRRIAAKCSGERISVVSGGARGVDSAAMQAAGEAGGRVIGVLADGLLQAVRNRQNRIGIEEQRLVLMSPFNPEAGFNAGNAMARNRYIYALADYALVVESDLRKGGTWAGAVEDLKEGWVPLFVRRDTKAPGNAALVREGGIPFDYQPDSGGRLLDYLAGATTVSKPQELFVPTASAAAVREETPQYANTSSTTVPTVELTAGSGAIASPALLDLYGEFLLRLEPLLERGALSQKEIARELGLEPAQAKAWLKRAEENGKVSLRGKAKKYSLPERGLF